MLVCAIAILTAVVPLQGKGHHGHEASPKTEAESGYRRKFPLPAPREFDGLGINVNGVQNASATDLQRMHDLGFKFVRADVVWSVVEKKKGKYDFSAYDKFVSDATQHDLRCYLTLDYNNPLYAANLYVGPHTDAERNGYASFASAAVNRFKGRGILWEIWNEPNYDHFWQPKAKVSDYVALAEAAGNAIRRVGPEEWLFLPACSRFDWTFLETCFKGGLLNLADGVSIHPYRVEEPASVADDWQRLGKMVEEYKPRGKPIELICGEWGYADTETSGKDLASDFAPAKTKNLLPTTDPQKMEAYWLKPAIKAGAADPRGGALAYRLASADKPSDPAKDSSGLLVTSPLPAGHYYTVSAWFKTEKGHLDLMLGLADSHVAPVHITAQWERKSVTILSRYALKRMFQVYETTHNNPAWFIAFPQVEETPAPKAVAANREAHGDAIVDIVRSNAASGVGLTIIYSWRDLGADLTNREHHFGIYDSAGNPKPAVRKLLDERKQATGH